MLVMGRKKPPKSIVVEIEQALRAVYDGKDGANVGPLFEGLIVCTCPYCGCVMAIFNPTTCRLTCVRCTSKSGRGWRQLASQLGIDPPLPEA